MRKQTKLVAALSATALLALGASAVVFAAGWDNSTGAWQYLDSQGNAVADAWRKSGDYWFYLDSDGNMATDQLIEDDDDYYYVNADGAMVTNQWVALDTDDNGNDEAEYRWFYFGSDGKAYRDKGTEGKLSTSDLKTINGKKYAFDEDGKMLYGWIDADNIEIQSDDDDAWQNSKYYFGGWNDGAAATGWVQLTVNTDNIGTDKDDQGDTFWFYFDGNGKKQTDKKKTIQGATYYFDEYGRMVTEWSQKATTSDGKTSKNHYNFVQEGSKATTNVVYTNGDGAARKNQWVWAVPDENYIKGDYDDDEYSWWWTNSNGEVFKNGVKKVNGKYYAFDSYGRMLYGVVVKSDDNYSRKDSGDKTFTDYTGDEWKAEDFSGDEIYYFSNDEEKDGSRKTGYVNVDFDDDTYQMYFKSNGKAANGYESKIKKYVRNGVVLKANNDDSNYGLVDPENPVNVEYVSTTGKFDGTKVLVNTAGTVQKNVKNRKDTNDLYYFTDKDGYVEYVSDESLTTSKGTKDDPNTYVFTYYKDPDTKTGKTDYYLSND